MADINEKTGGSGFDGIYLGVKYNYFEIITNIASEICRVCLSPIRGTQSKGGGALKLGHSFTIFNAKSKIKERNVSKFQEQGGGHYAPIAIHLVRPCSRRYSYVVYLQGMKENRFFIQKYGQEKIIKASCKL